MGNSGSIHNIAADHENLHPYLQHSQTHLGEHQPLKWTQSYPRDSTHAQQHQLHHHPHQQQQQQHQQQHQQAHVKVLPDLNEGPRLRFTANGAILQSGGTISGRKESLPQPPLLQRSKTSIHYNLGNRHSSDGFNRTPDDLGGPMHDRGDAKELAYKRFGSEPDLRTNGDDDNSALSVTKISKSKMVKNKKRRTAPPPPRDQRPAEGEYNLTPNSGHQKKLRLFKTKTESRKASVQTKLAAEASDLHFKRSTLGATDQQIGAEPPRRNMQYLPPPEPRESPPKKPLQHTMDSGWQESKVKVLPMPMPPTAFRREKSFDASLLTSHKQSIAEEVGPVKNARERQRLSPGRATHSPAVEKRSASRQMSADLERPLRKSAAESGKRAAMRKYSQPAQLRSTDFKKELEEATKRRSMIVQSLDKENDDGRLRQGGQTVPVAKARVARTKGDKPGTEPPVEPKRRIESKIPQLTKTFYFGMDGKRDTGTARKDPDDFGKVQMDVIDEFAKNILTNRRQQRAGGYESSESALSSEEGYPMAGMTAGYEENSDGGGIHVHVRPTLPRRQLEIPRFSPAAAWRMLNDEQKDAVFFGRGGTNLFASDMAVEPKQPLEERIQRIYREPNPLYPDNKSGDSGISGDAGLPERTDSPRQNFVNAVEQENERQAKVGPFLKPWIPQQDLDEDTSSDGGDVTKIDDTNKFSSRGHVFSLSLPRESHMSAYDEKDKPGFSSLQKLKKTVSNALFSAQDRITSYRSDNWLLSRSAPNSIENTQMLPGNSGQHQLSAADGGDGGEHQQIVAIQPSSFSYFTGGKHVMYLPNHPIGEVSDQPHFDRIDGEGSGRSKFCEGDAVGKNKDRKYSSHNRAGQVNGGGKERESLQDVIPKVKEERTGCKGNSSKSRVHRFTFQSTVRQIERRRIADKLSKEAEEKEAQRLSELEAMRKVEEEFQRKRAREKASIRHQLRLFSLEESQCTSLPVDWQLIESQNHRAEPDGAVSSPTPSPTSNDEPITQDSDHHHQHHRKLHNPNNTNKFPATEVLSEYHTMRREYLDYRNEKKFEYHHHQNEHPSIVCKIPPKNSEVYSYDDVGYGANNSAILLDNYRREFARGRSICSSDSDLSTPSGDGMTVQRSQYRCRNRSPSPSP